MVDGVILAGGFASRISQNKMLLIYKNKPLIYHTVKAMKSICKKVTIVTGHYNEKYLEVLKEFDNVEIVHNKNYKLGMFSSVLMGVKNTHNDVFIIPGDIPLVKKETYQKLYDSSGEIRVPIFNNRKGHPIFISKRLVDKLRNENINSNLKSFRDQHEVNYIDVEDSNVLRDIDNKEDYKQLLDERNDSNEN